MDADEPILSDPDVEAEPSTRAAAELQTLLMILLLHYDELVAFEQRDHAWTWVERIARHWRQAGELHHLEMTGDWLLGPEAVESLAAVESTLTLLALEDPDAERLMLEEGERTRRMLAIAQTGLWPGFDVVYDRMWEESERMAGRPASERPPDWPPPAQTWKRPRRTDKRITRALTAEIEQKLSDASEIYQRLDPDGRELSDDERQGAYAYLADQAVYGRRMDAGGGAYCERDWSGVLLTLAALRSVGRNLVLALSGEPDVRRLAMSSGEWRTRAYMLRLRAEGASWADALRAVTAIAQEHHDPAAEPPGT